MSRPSCHPHPVLAVLSCLQDAAAVPTGCGAGNLLRSVGGTFSGNNYYCASGVACPVSVAPTDLSVSLDPASAGSCRVTASSSSCNADIAATCSTTCCPVSYTCNLEQIGAVTAKQFREGGVGNLAFICVVVSVATRLAASAAGCRCQLWVDPCSGLQGGCCGWGHGIWGGGGAGRQSQ
jgi:hypothetical protein